mgnify:CR=1 FL=1
MDIDTQPTDIAATEPEPVQPATAPTIDKPVVTPATSATATDTTPAWVKTIDETDAAELRRHPKLAGIIGSEAQRISQLRSKHDQETESRRIHDATEAELLKFTDDNTDYLKQYYPKAYDHIMSIQASRARRDIDGVKVKALDEVAQRVGASIRQLPEFAEFTQQDHERLVKAAEGKTDDDALATIYQTVLDISANKRLAKLLAKETDRIREAVRQEEAAKLMRDSDAPDLAKPKSIPTKINILGMSAEEYDKLFPPNVPLLESHKKIFG